jgi:3-hydroxyacyl-CoA dehydrogenase
MLERGDATAEDIDAAMKVRVGHREEGDARHVL